MGDSCRDTAGDADADFEVTISGLLLNLGFLLLPSTTFPPLTDASLSSSEAAACELLIGKPDLRGSCWFKMGEVGDLRASSDLSSTVL